MNDKRGHTLAQPPWHHRLRIFVVRGGWAQVRVGVGLIRAFA